MSKKDEALKLAREKFACQYSQLPVAESRIEAFFQAAYDAGAADENEACAKVADEKAGSCLHPDEIAEAIRARRQA